MRSLPTPRTPSDGEREGWAVITTLIGGFVLWGGIGWLLDRWLDTRFLTPIFVIVGMVLGIYAVVARAGLPGAIPNSRSEKADHRAPSASAGARRENQ